MPSLRGALLGLVTLACLVPSQEKPAGPVDAYGDPLPEGAVARLGTTRLRGGHAEGVAFSLDGRVLASCGYGPTANLWDPATGREILQVSSAKRVQIWRVALSPDGSLLATFDYGGVRFFDAGSGLLLRREEDFAYAQNRGTRGEFAFSADGKTLYVGGFDGVHHAVHVADARPATLPRPPEPGLTLRAFSPDGKAGLWVADKRVVVGELGSGKALASLASPEPFDRLALSWDASRLAVATPGKEPAVVVYDLATGKEVCRAKGHRGPVTSLAFATDGKALLTGSVDLTVRLWDAATGAERWSYRGDVVYNIHGMRAVIAPDGKTVAAVGWEGVIRLLDAATGKERVPLTGHLLGVLPVAVLPDGKRAVTAGNGQLVLWDLATGKAIRTVLPPPVHAFDPDTQRIVVPSGGLDSGNSFQLTPDGKALAVRLGGGLRFWPLDALDRPPAGEPIPCRYSATLSPDGRTLADSTDRLRIIDLATRRAVREVDAPWAVRLRFSPDGRLLAHATSKGEVRLYDPATLREVAAFGDGSGREVSQLEFSPDGQLLAASGSSWHVAVWEVATGRQRWRIDRKASMMSFPAFSPDGRFLAVGGMDHRVAIHDAATGQLLHTFEGHKGDTFSLAFTPDGRRLVSGSLDTTALVWDMSRVPAPVVEKARWPAADLEALWGRLAGDADDANAAMCQLRQSPDQAVELAARLRQADEKVPAARVAGWVRDLDAEEFEAREAASEALAALGDEAAEPLRRALAENPSAELRLRAEALLKRLKEQGPRPKHLRGLRLVQVLEWVGTPAVLPPLEALAAGDADADLTRAAAGAVRRLKGR